MHLNRQLKPEIAPTWACRAYGSTGLNKLPDPEMNQSPFSLSHKILGSYPQQNLGFEQPSTLNPSVGT